MNCKATIYFGHVEIEGNLTKFAILVLLVKSLFSGAYKILRNDREQIAVKKGHHDVSLSTDWMSFP